MKGMVFTALERFLEDRYGDGLVDHALRPEGLSSGGAYTSVGYYPHGDFSLILGRAARQLEEDPHALTRSFGSFLFGQLAASHRELMQRYSGPVELLSQIEDVIHVNVRKLYSDTELPKFDVEERQADRLIVLRYSSARPFADLAHGLIEGCVHYFGLGDEATLERFDLSSDGTDARFKLAVHGEADGGGNPGRDRTPPA